MVFTEFAPNETRSDFVSSIKILFQPWTWKKGKHITKLKSRLKRRYFHDTSEMFLFMTGRCGLYHTLKGLELPLGAEVLVQAFTCEAVILPILELKLNPVYVDINKNDFSIDIDDLEKKIQYSPQPKVLILQHTFGIKPKQRDAIIRLAKLHKLHIIEDAAHGFEQDIFKKKPLTSTVILSFGRSKPFSSFFGGAIVTKNKKLLTYLSIVEKKLPYPSLALLLKGIFYKMMTPFIKMMYPLYIGKMAHIGLRSLNLLTPEITSKEKKGVFDNQFARSFPNLYAYFAIQQLNRYNDVIKMRENLTDFYNMQFKTEYKGALLRYPLVIQDPNKIIKKAQKSQIYLGQWYSQPVAPAQVNLRSVRYKPGTCPQAEYITQHIINLPTNISKKDAKRIVQLIED